MFVLAEVHFRFLDAREDLVEQSLILGLLAVLRHRCKIGLCGRAGQAVAGLNARKRAVWRLDGFVAELVCDLLASAQQLVVFHLENTYIFLNKMQTFLE